MLEARKVGDAEEQRAYRDKFERLGPAVEYFRIVNGRVIRFYDSSCKSTLLKTLMTHVSFYYSAPRII